MKGLEFIETLQITLKKKPLNTDKTIIKTAYFNSKTHVIINENEISAILQASKQEILNTIAQWVSEGSGWTIESVDEHYLNIIKYEPLKGSSYTKLPQELQN